MNLRVSGSNMILKHEFKTYQKHRKNMDVHPDKISKYFIICLKLDYI